MTTPDKGNTFLEIDRSMFGHQADASVRLFADGGPIDLSLTNSYLRGYVTIDSYSAPLDVDIVNNTFVGAFHVMAHNATGTIANNIFANASQASIVKYNLHPVVFSHNAYWNNAVNFRGGGVSSGVGDLFVDCQLATNSEGLPVIRAGSPCQGAGNSDLATEKDLLDRSRDARPDIGAIEAQ